MIILFMLIYGFLSLIFGIWLGRSLFYKAPERDGTIIVSEEEDKIKCSLAFDKYPEHVPTKPYVMFEVIKQKMPVQ